MEYHKHKNLGLKFNYKFLPKKMLPSILHWELNVELFRAWSALELLQLLIEKSVVLETILGTHFFRPFGLASNFRFVFMLLDFLQSEHD